MRQALKPTSRDLKVYDYLKAGNSINSISALQLFKTTGLRDIVYRLRKADYDIEGQSVYYKTEEGVQKNYKNYFLKKAA